MEKNCKVFSIYMELKSVKFCIYTDIEIIKKFLAFFYIFFPVSRKVKIPS